MKWLILPILCGTFFAVPASADDNGPTKIEKEYNACATLVRDGKLTGERKAECKIYIRAYEGGHSNGYEKARNEIFNSDKNSGFIAQRLTNNGGWRGHQTIPFAVAPQVNPISNTGGVATDLGAIKIDPKVLEAAKLKFEKLPSGDYALVSE